MLVGKRFPRWAPLSRRGASSGTPLAVSSLQVVAVRNTGRLTQQARSHKPSGKKRLATQAARSLPGGAGEQTPAPREAGRNLRLSSFLPGPPFQRQSPLQFRVLNRPLHPLSLVRAGVVSTSASGTWIRDTVTTQDDVASLQRGLPLLLQGRLRDEGPGSTQGPSFRGAGLCLREAPSIPDCLVPRV